LAHRRTQDVGREEILSRQPAGEERPAHLPNKQILIDEIAAWEHDRNANHTKAGACHGARVRASLRLGENGIEPIRRYFWPDGGSEMGTTQSL
jgi:hypothetical protein